LAECSSETMNEVRNEWSNDDDWKEEYVGECNEQMMTNIVRNISCYYSFYLIHHKYHNLNPLFALFKPPSNYQ